MPMFRNILLICSLFVYIIISNPMPDREPYFFKSRNSNHFNVYQITNYGISMAKDLNRERMEFWNDIFDEYKHLWNTTFHFYLA